MKLQDVLAELNETSTVEEVRPHWDESAATMPQETPFFLQPEQMRTNREWGNLPAEVEPVLEETARRITASPALLHLAWHCYRRLVEHPDSGRFNDWPALEKALGELSGTFYLVVGLGIVPRVRAVHEAMGVPEQITRDTCKAVGAMTMAYRREFPARVGVPRAHIAWYRHHVAGRIFRLGRMEYMVGRFAGKVEVYRHCRTSRVLALAADGVRFDGEGYLGPQAESEGAQDGWTSSLIVDDKAIRGYPVSPFGMAIRREVRLSPDAWRRVLGNEHFILDMHIPEGGGMTLEKCRQSMQDAIGFFRRFFPDKPFVAVASNSWIFNNQLENILPETSNLVRYLGELYLFPVPATGRDGFYFIFGRDRIDPATAPRNTSVQRAILDFLTGGGKWRGGGMFFLTDDVEHFGEQYYRSRFSGDEIGGLR